MKRYRFGCSTRRAAFGVTLAFSLMLVGACSLSTAPDNKPTRAVIEIDGTSPNALTLVISTDFFEQLNTGTNPNSLRLPAHRDYSGGLMSATPLL